MQVGAVFEMMSIEFGGFPGGSVEKNLPATAGDSGFISGREDPLEKGLAVHSSIHAWRIPWIEAWQAAVHGVRHNLVTKQQQNLITY